MSKNDDFMSLFLFLIFYFFRINSNFSMQFDNNKIFIVVVENTYAARLTFAFLDRVVNKFNSYSAFDANTLAEIIVCIN